MRKLSDEIYALEKEIQTLIKNNVSDDVILKKVKELDGKIKEYNNKWGGNTNEISYVMDNVNSWYIQYAPSNDDYETAKDEANNELQNEINNYENQQNILGSSTANGSHSIDEIISEGKNFIAQATGNKISGSNLQAASNTLYNILLTIGIFLAVAVGMYLGIKFMVSSAEDKAKVKESLIPYIAGCVVIFGAFIIWKLAITLLSAIA